MKKMLLATAATLLCAMAAPAYADSVTVSGSLTSDHCTDGCGPQTGGFGTVTVVDNGLGTGSNVGTLGFTVNLINGNNFVSGGQDVTFGFNLLNNPTITYTNLDTTAPVPIWSVVGGNPQSAGSLHADGFGNVEYGVELGGNGNSCGSTGCPTSLTFSISAPGLDWTDLAQASSNGTAVMVADIFSGTTHNTGFVDLTGALTPTQTSAVPGPIVGAGLPGIFAAFAAFWGIGVKRRRKNAMSVAQA